MTTQCASQIILSWVLQSTWQAIALPVCAAGFHLTDRNASQLPGACRLSCLSLKLLIDTHETPQDCKLFTGVRNYTSGYTQFLPWFLHSKTSWRCQMYSLMVQREQWPANRPWAQHSIPHPLSHCGTAWAHPNIQELQALDCCYRDGNRLGSLIKYCSVLYWYKRCSAWQPNHKPLQPSEGNNCF